MKIEYFRTFLKVVDLGSFTKASRVLKQPVSRVSRTIQNLEEAIGAPLLYRTTRQLNLTQTGKALYDQIRRPLGDLESALDVVRGSSGEVSGVLRVTAIGDLAPVVTALCAKFRDRFTRVRFELILEDRVLDLARESIDVGLRLGVLADSSLKSVRVGELGGIFVASPEYLARSSSLVSLENLAQHVLLYFGEAAARPEWRLRGGARVKVEPAFMSSHTGAILNLALNGQGVALLPRFLCADFLRAGRLAHVLREFDTKPLPVHLVWNRNAKVQNLVRAFIEFARGELAEAGALER